MKKTRKFLKNIVVSFLIFYIIIANTSSSFARNFDDGANTSSSFARNFDDGAREFLATQTEQFIHQYNDASIYSVKGENVPAHFDENKTHFYCCCTTGVAYMYEIFLGLDIYALRF